MDKDNVVHAYIYVCVYIHVCMCVCIYIYIYIYIYNAHRQWNAILPFATTWIELEGIIFSEKGRERQILHYITI